MRTWAVRPVGAATLVVASSAWMATAGNLALWRELQAQGLLQGLAGWGLAAALAVVIGGALAALMALAAWPRALKPLVLLLLVSTALGAHFMLSYGVVIDSTMMVNVLQTDRHESVALLSGALLFNLAWAALLPGWVVLRLPVARLPWRRQALRNLGLLAGGLALVVLALFLSFQPLSSAMRNHKQLRYLMNPLNSLYAVGQVSAAPLRRGSTELQPLGRDARLPPATGRPPLLVLVVGETARSANFGLNGYGRPTTPELARRQAVSFRQVLACGTSTAASLPCMFSHLGREAFADRTGEHENLLDVLQHAGLAVFWLDNQAGCKGVCDRVGHALTPRADQPGLCDGGECLDEVMLQHLDERIAALPAARRERGVVLVLHQMGSHGPAYSRRSPATAKPFQPECRSVNLQDCSREELLNAYDNSIAYTDRVLGRTLDWLHRREADYDTALVYVSDHGESLGENNLYLHGMPYAIAPQVQKHVPWVTWMSPGFESRSGISADCLRGRLDQPLTHDNYFHSVLGLLQVQTSVYRRTLDAYAGCVTP